MVVTAAVPPVQGLRLPRNKAVPGRRNAPVDGASLARALGQLLGPSAATAEVRAFEAIARCRRVASNDAVMSRQERAQAAVLLVEGDAALGLRLADGGFEIERIVHAPAWLDLGSVWIGANHAADAQANGPAVVAELPREPMRQVLERNPGLSMRVIQSLAREHQVMASQTHGLMHLAAPARLAQWLRQNAKPAGGSPQGQAVVRLAERKRDLAAQLAIAPETLSRLLRAFTRQGVIDVAGYTVHVLDRAALERMAQV
ncbi:MAG: Crp/Fnr family transcriptional regulator [Burkholderiaceae bacterium]|nr:Crp/Fnr family transcriptional regulator [Burkholderiaceae bacterium]